MRIALLTNFIPPYRVPLFRALAARTDALRIFVSTTMEANRAWTPDWADLDVVPQRSIAIPHRWRHPSGFSERTWLHLPYDTLPALTRFRPEVVISGELGARTLQSVLWGRYIGRCPVLAWATVSERQEQGRGRARLRRWLLRHADGAIVNGASGARYVGRLGVPAARTFVLPYTTDLERFSSPSLTRAPGAAHRLLHVGALNERKGVLLLLEALERRARARPDQCMELALAGEGPLRDALERRPLPSNLRTSFLGHVAYDDLPDLYREAGILAFPSLADEWGMVVNEAMASGVPVLGSIHAQAVTELVADGVNGWHFDPEDAASFDRALARALDTPAAALDSMREAGRTRAAACSAEDGARRLLAAAQAVRR